VKTLESSIRSSKAIQGNFCPVNVLLPSQKKLRKKPLPL
jgi:hypothetical protein